MTTTAPPRSLELPPVALSSRPLRLDLPRFQLVRTTPPAPEPVPTIVAEPALHVAAATAPARVPAPAAIAAAPAPAIAAPTVASPALAPPTSIAPVVATPSLTRRDGTLGLAIGILVVTIVLAAALAMQRSMHGWPPGMH